MKIGHGLRSRSSRAVHDDSVAVATVPVADALKQSCWANMPPELLRDVLSRIEEEESSWPRRRQVVACAGVCRSWRDIMMQILNTVEVSGKLTLPISLKQPGPRDFLLQCFIKRNQTTQTYYLYLGLTQALSDNGKFLLAAQRGRRPTCTDYIISLDPDAISRGGGSYIGKLRSNFLGTRFVVYDGAPAHAGTIAPRSRPIRLLGSRQVSPRMPAGNHPVAHIAYELNVMGSRGPRRMHCVMDSIPASAIETGGVAPIRRGFPHGGAKPSPSSIPSFRSNSSPREATLVLQNKVPRWHEQLQCWCLNFRGRVTVASVKNFQLVASAENGLASEEHDEVLLQFGKVGRDLFTMDYRYPLSAFQAFAICLSSFDTKIACE